MNRFLYFDPPPIDQAAAPSVAPPVKSRKGLKKPMVRDACADEGPDEANRIGIAAMNSRRFIRASSQIHGPDNIQWP